MVLVMFEPTFVVMLGALAVTVKSLTESVTLVERVRLFSAALTLVIATVAFAGGVAPKVVCRVTTDERPVAPPGVIVGGFAEQVVLPVSAGGSTQLTAMSCVMPASGVKLTV